MGNFLDVPYIKQPKKSTKCGAACAAMIIKFYTSTKIDLDLIWSNISAYSPELGRKYCRTFKIGAYISDNFFNCCTIRYINLKDLLEFCNSNGIAPIINHKSFENKIFGHFSVVKNVTGPKAVINDPENQKRISVFVNDLALLAKKNENINDEVGHNTAIIPILNKFSVQSKPCPHCGKPIDISFSSVANLHKKIVIEDLCQYCDKFSKVS